MPTLKFTITTESEAASKAIKSFAADVGASVEDVAKKAKKSGDDQKGTFGALKEGYLNFKTFAVDAINGVKQVWDFGKEGAENVRIADSFAETAKSVGVDAKEMEKALASASHGMVDDELYMQVATRNMAFGVATSLKSNIDLMNLARVATKRFGGDAGEAYQGISTAIANLQTRALKEYGIIVNATDANKKYAAAHGLVADAMTEEEQRAALLQAVMEKAPKLMQDFGDSADTASEKMKRAEVAIGNIVDGVKEFVASGITAGVELVEGPQRMAEAFTGTAAKIRKDVMSGKMSVEDYNNAIKGMANAMSGYLGPAATNLLIQQWQVNAAMVDAAQTTDAADRATRRYADAQANLAAQEAANTNGTAALAAAQSYITGAMGTYQAGIDKVNAAHAASQQILATVEAAQATYRGSIAETISTIDNMAKSLKDATTAQANQAIAQSQIDTLKKAYAEGKIPLSDYTAATDQLLLKYDLATPKSLAMSKATEAINTAFLNGQLPLDLYLDATGKIPKLAEDGKVTMQELVKLGLDPTTTATSNQTAKVGELITQWSKVPSTVKTTYIIETQGTAPVSGTGTGKEEGFQHGADFIVPQGYDRDGYHMRVSSGEYVSVKTPIQQILKGIGGGLTISAGAIVINGAGQNARQIARQVIQELGRMTSVANKSGAGMIGQ